MRKPIIGALLFLIFCFGFVMLYRPLKTQGAQSLSFTVTMAVYFFSTSVSVFVIILVLKRFKYFSDGEKWTFVKELISVFLVLSVTGITVYFLGFVIEEPAQRWNLRTFFNSYIDAFLIGIIPFGFFTLSNYRHLLVDEMVQNYESASLSQPSEEIVRISSTLKKEELSFYPSQFIYAESDGNYVVFYLVDNQHIRKEIIRNSISDIERQLAKIPFIIRTHRAFIVNLKKIKSKKGNTLGYRLNLPGVDSVVPVSRQRVHHFDELLKRYR